MQLPPFDPEDPPEDPPFGTRIPVLWQVAIRLYREHTVELRLTGRRRGRFCRMCRVPWPCTARRLAERGLCLAVLGCPA